MATISVQITGLTQAQKRLLNLEHGLIRLDKGMREIGEYLSRYYENEGFASQGQVFGSTWPRLNLKYAQWKAKNFSGAGPLIRTGTMKESFTFSSGSQSVAITNTAPYFKYHQSTLPRTKIPRRAMMGLNSTNKTMIRDILREDIRQKLAA